MKAKQSALSRPFHGDRVVPEFQLTLEFTLLYLRLIMPFPLSALLLNTLSMTWEAFWQAVSASYFLFSNLAKEALNKSTFCSEPAQLCDAGLGKSRA